MVAANLLASLHGLPLPAAYDGYVACPFTTARDRVLLAEFDYTLTHRPSFPRLDTTRPRYDMWLLKRYGRPWFYWNMPLRGRG